MLILHVLIGLVVGILAAAWVWLSGASLWTMLGYYVLGGNAGIGLTVALALIRPRSETSVATPDLHPAE
jgi:hypothetical protein